ncbi:MAG: Sigma-70, region 4 [Cyanobacteria bacterium RYN_339]|nr:Sigma-70, region 4 [Cyanobacteria bacterium RYN_339]
MPDPTDLELARSAAGGDDAAWNEFLGRFGDLILGASMGWCEAGCRIPRGDYDCILRTIRASKPEPAEAPDGCREGIKLYQHACLRLRPRLAEYDGTSSLQAFVLATLAAIQADYVEAERGRLTLPPALEAASPRAQDLYRLACRVESRLEVARRLGVGEDELVAAEREVAAALKGAGLAWWGLEPQLEAVEPLPGPSWVHRGVLVEGDSPEPIRKNDTIWRKVFSQPDWLAGLAVGAVTAALCLLVVIPRQEYAKSVREPADELIARSERALEPPLEAKLQHARQALSKGKVDTALLDLNGVLAVRGDDQEARWLLATTYDRLGDQGRAAQHYKLFLDVDGKLRTSEDARVKRAREKLGSWSELP